MTESKDETGSFSYANVDNKFSPIRRARRNFIGRNSKSEKELINAT
jgi:hypothetical protein